MRKFFTFYIFFLFFTSLSLALNGGTDIFDPRLNSQLWSYTVKINSDGNTCTGVIISSNQVLTAAHCVFDMSELLNRKSLIPLKVTRLAVIHESIEPNGSVSEQTIDVTSFEVHPLFYKKIWQAPLPYSTLIGIMGDLAVLKLSRTITTPFKKANIASSFTSNTPLQVIGWAHGAHQAEFKIKNLSSDPMLLLDGKGAFAICPGDSGGPAFLMNNGIPEIVGISSASKCALNEPALSTNLLYYKDWLNEILNTN